MKIVWSAEARRSLRAIQKFIAQDSEFYAARVVSRIIYLPGEDSLQVVTIVHFKQVLKM